MKFDMIRMANYFELEHFNNINNRIAMLNHIAPLIPGLMASVRDKLLAFDGNIDDVSESTVGALLVEINETLTKAFADIDAVNNKVNDWFDRVNKLELKAPVEPEPVTVEPEPVTVEPEPVTVEPEPVTVEPEPVDDTTSADDVTSTDPIYNDITDNPPNYGGDSADIIIPSED